MVHDTYDTHDTYSQDSNKKKYENARWQKSRIVKKNHKVFVWFLHGCEIQKNRYAEIVKKT